MGRSFQPIVFTTLLGIGPLSARAYLDSLFTAAYLDERAAGGTGSDTAHRRLIFITGLQAAAIRGTEAMLSSLVLQPARDAAAASGAGPSAAPAPSGAGPSAAPAAGASAHRPPWDLSVEDAALLPDATWSSPLVVPCHGQPPSHDTYDVYVGRGGPGDLRWGSPCPWGNQFLLNRYSHLPPRFRLIAATIDFLHWTLLPAQTALRLRAHRELAGRRLGCWCPQPGPCHAHAWAWIVSLPSDRLHSPWIVSLTGPAPATAPAGTPSPAPSAPATVASHDPDP